VFLGGAEPGLGPRPVWIARASGALHRFEKAQVSERTAGQVGPPGGSKAWASAAERCAHRERRQGECLKTYPQW
jgi:hypothetical protein